MKIVQCNMGYSGYWLACWRELMRRVDLQVFTPETRYPYSSEALREYPIRVLDAAEMDDGTLVNAVVCARPDVLVVGGWNAKSFVQLAFEPRLQHVPKILIIDAAWEGTLKQYANRFRLRKFTRQFKAIIVGGKRGRVYARWLGFGGENIFRSIYGYDADSFSSCYAERMSLPGGWPNRFCFIGRYASVKGVDVLIEAYRIYRHGVLNPWPLDCYGSGDLRVQLVGIEGIVDHGFLQPSELPKALVQEGAFVFPSLHEPWGVAAVEAAGAGLPLICSDKVTSADDVVRSGENGYIVKVGDARALANAMKRMHDNLRALPKMGERSVALAADFAPKAWADRWMEVFHVVGR